MKTGTAKSLPEYIEPDENANKAFDEWYNSGNLDKFSDMLKQLFNGTVPAQADNATYQVACEMIFAFFTRAKVQEGSRNIIRLTHSGILTKQKVEEKKRLKREKKLKTKEDVSVHKKEKRMDLNIAGLASVLGITSKEEYEEFARSIKVSKKIEKIEPTE